VIGIPYLKEASKEEAKTKIEIGHGPLWGLNARPLFPCVVSSNQTGRTHWVIFLVDTGSPSTYISQETADILGIESNFADATVGGYNYDIRISPQTSHFPDLNLLGSTFLALRDVALLHNMKEKRLDVVFHWKRNWAHEALKKRL